jgi:hypothetical protein
LEPRVFWLGAALAALAAIVWTIVQRPSAAQCATWADRHLRGESAYATLLETADSAASTPATQWLAQWATARVPVSVALIAAHRNDRASLRAALVSLAVSAAIAATIVMTVDPESGATRTASTRPSAGGPAAAADVSRPPAEPAQQLAAALRTGVGREPAASAVRTGAGSDAATDDTDTGRAPARSSQGPAGSKPASTAAGAQDEASPPAERGRLPSAAGTGSGNDAGTSRDTRRDQGISTVAVAPASAAAGRDRRDGALIGPRTAVEQPASYDRGDPSASAFPPAPIVAAAAADPPSARRAMRLSPTRAAYVQAWMTATEGLR